MTSMLSMADRTRQERVLAVALEVFGRYGFSKAALFRAAVRQELETALGDVSCCLNEEGVGLERRAVAALDAWLGRYVGSQLTSDIGALLQNPAMELGDMFDPAIA